MSTKPKTKPDAKSGKTESAGKKSDAAKSDTSKSETSKADAPASDGNGGAKKAAASAGGVSYFSSRGPTGDGRSKPDLVAPGEKIVSTFPGGRQDALAWFHRPNGLCCCHHLPP